VRRCLTAKYQGIIRIIQSEETAFSVERRGPRVTLRGPEGRYSVYDPERVFTGMGWDAEAASALLVGVTPRSALLLGYGGGTAARQLRVMFPCIRLIGVEIDARIAGLAKREFSSATIGAAVVTGCGERFIRAGRQCYDFILDDMWDHDQRRRRAISADPRWLEGVVRRLTRRGVYAANVYVRACAPAAYDFAICQLRRHFVAVTCVRLPWESVCVLAGSREPVRPERIGRLLSRIPGSILHALGEIEFTSC
jgi:predicted membrane-bound spermidine synthase